MLYVKNQKGLVNVCDVIITQLPLIQLCCVVSQKCRYCMAEEYVAGIIIITCADTSQIDKAFPHSIHVEGAWKTWEGLGS